MPFSIPHMPAIEENQDGLSQGWGGEGGSALRDRAAEGRTCRAGLQDTHRTSAAKGLS